MSRKRNLFAVLGTLLLLLSGWAVWLWLFQDLPTLDSLSGHLFRPSVRIVDRNGRLLYEALDQVGGRHTIASLEQIPLTLKQATIATEDHRFYQNPGVDITGILRALWVNVRGGETLAGGSTITQQVARNLLFSPQERLERSLRRKLRESLLAWRLARRFSKDEILSLYLNQMYYGSLAYGVEAAAQTYFGKSVESLDLAEATLLAGLPQAPALYDPFVNLETAKARQAVVLERMQAEGYLNAAQVESARREPLALTTAPYPMLAPHFVLMVQRELDSLLSPERLQEAGGMVVRTTLDLDWQQAAERAVTHQIQRVQEQGEGVGHNLNSAALVSLDPQTGEVLALVGSPDYADASIDGAINMTLAPRQPGSSIKPLVYAAALDPEQLQPWTAGTMLLDVTTSFRTHEGLAYTPSNYDGREHGPVLVRQALASSLNIPAVLAMEKVGLPELFSLASNLGLTTLKDPQRFDLSLALGGGEVRLIELTAAYAAFANQGYRVQPSLILEITDPAGRLVYEAPPPDRLRVLDERVAWLLSDILSDDEARRLGFGANSVLRLDRPAAVKTGTTSNFHDNWTIGYTPEVVTGVWAGNTNYEPMRDITGLTGAAPIWHEFMRAVLAGQPKSSFPRPEGLVQVEICALSGGLPTSACPYRRKEWFIQGTQPTQPDTVYRTIALDRTTGKIARSDAPPASILLKTVLDLPIEARSWANTQGLRLFAEYSSLALSSDVSQGSSETQKALLRLTSPASGAVFQLAEGYSAETQKIRLDVAVQGEFSQVSLILDGVRLAEFPSPLLGETLSFWWTLERGQHELWAAGTTAQGQQIESSRVTFEVQ